MTSPTSDSYLVMKSFEIDRFSRERAPENEKKMFLLKVSYSSLAGAVSYTMRKLEDYRGIITIPILTAFSPLELAVITTIFLLFIQGFFLPTEGVFGGKVPPERTSRIPH